MSDDEAKREAQKARRLQRWAETRQFRLMGKLLKCWEEQLKPHEIAAWVWWLASRYKVK